MVRVNRPERRVETPKTPMDTFNVDYSGIARAGQSIAAGFAAIGRSAEEREQENKQRQRFDTLTNFNTWQTQTQMELEQFKQGTAIGTANYLEQVEGLVETARSRFMNDVPAELQDEFNMRSTAVKNAFILGNMEFDLSQKDLYFSNKISDQLNGLKKTIHSDPSALEAARTAINETIDAAVIPEAKKLEQRRLANAALAAIALQKEAQNARMREIGTFTGTSGSPTAARDLAPEAYAFLNTIAGPESGGRYNVRYDGSPTGATFDSYAQHPGIKVKGSTAAGRYMITKQTWDEFAPKVGATDFSPANQDKVAWAIAEDTVQRKTGSTIAAMIAQGRTGELRDVLKDRWVVLADDEKMPVEKFVSEMEKNGVRTLSPGSVSFTFNGTTGTAAELGTKFSNFKNIDPDVINRVGTAFSSLGLENVRISSGYRSEAHNEKVGGAKKSQHIHGKAVDIDVSKMNIEERKNLIRALSAAGITGLGVGANIIHADTGNRRAWGYAKSSGGGAVPGWAEDVIADHLAGKIASGGTQNLITDARYADVPYETMIGAIAEGQRAADAEYNKMVDAQQKKERAQVNQLHVGLADGLYGVADIAQARKDGWLTDYDDIKKAQDILKKYNEETDLLRKAQEHIDSGRDWRQGNEDDAKEANALYKKGGVEDALNERDEEFVQQQFIPNYEKMQYAAPMAVEHLKAMAANRDPAAAMFALETLRQMRERAPDAFGRQFDEATQRKIDRLEGLNSYLEGEELLKAVTGAGLDQADRQAQQALQEQGAELFDKELKITPENVTEEVFSRFGPFNDPSPPLAPAGKAMMFKEYRELFIDSYRRTGDQDVAEQLAQKALRRQWGSTSIGGTTRMMKYPPQAAGYQPYPDANGSLDWIDEQVREDFNFDEDVQFQLVATEKTESQIAAYKADPAKNAPPEYLIWYVKPNGEMGFAKAPDGTVRGVYFKWTDDMVSKKEKEWQTRQTIADRETVENKYREIRDRQLEWDLQHTIGASRGGQLPTSPRPVMPPELEEEFRQITPAREEEAAADSAARARSRYEGKHGDRPEPKQLPDEITSPVTGRKYKRPTLNDRKKSRTGGR